MSILSAPYFHNEAAAYDFVETRLWPQGPVCPKCGCEATILDANKCLIEDTPFMCHERKGKPCSGWVTMRIKDSKLKAPWPFSYDDAHPDAIDYSPQPQPSR